VAADKGVGGVITSFRPCIFELRVNNVLGL
jgi:hypothetical protein